MRLEPAKNEMVATEVVATETLSAASQRTLWYRVLDLKELLQQNPERTHLYAELAFAYQSLGRWREALEWWERFLVEQPEGPAAERGWSEWRLLQGRYRGQLQDLVAQLRDSAVAVRRQAAGELSVFHDPTTETPLRAALNDPDPEVRGLAMCGLKRIKDELRRAARPSRRRGSSLPLLFARRSGK